ncbi:uncharacterized protein LOC129318508 [Prosopis cineraria]|uniref:uncharacterized protein LOC129318508 n=1 Tax=Prosopis cineraria TaxID=364024 RepID=UPI0024106B9B|nr:uncharacterized protein LOC129318508 [Prosopis cineraria]
MTIMLSSFAQGLRPDAFLSFQAKDSSILADKLYNALHESKINVFKDVESLELGKHNCRTQLKALRESRVSIIVFSSSYGVSPWCLDTLVLIINDMKTKGKLVLPVFYKVNPSGVHPTGSLHLTVAQYESMLNDDDETKEYERKLALCEAAHMHGWSIKQQEEFDAIIPRIVEEVSRGNCCEHQMRSAKSTENTIRYQGRPRHDVFLSYRETKRSNIFVDNLYDALYESKIKAFKDVWSSGCREDFCPPVLRAIEESSIFVIVFSEYYAYSPWCLDTLARILDSIETNDKVVLPVFYDVDPSDVKYQTGSFGSALADHECKFMDSMEKVQRWKLALSEVSHVHGRSLKEGEEHDVIPSIVEDVYALICVDHSTNSGVN